MTASADTALVIAQIKDEAELFQALAIREVVFIEEQHVPETVERDAEDARAYHVLAFAEGHAVGNGQLGSDRPDGSAAVPPRAQGRNAAPELAVGRGAPAGDVRSPRPLPALRA